MTLLITGLTILVALDISLRLGIPGSGFLFLLWFFLAGVYGCAWYKELEQQGHKCLSIKSICLWGCAVVGWEWALSQDIGTVMIGVIIIIIAIAVNYATIDKEGNLTPEQRMQKLLANGFIIVMVIAAIVVFILPLLNRGKKKK